MTMDGLELPTPKRLKLEFMNVSLTHGSINKNINQLSSLENAVTVGDTAKVQQLLNLNLQLNCTQGGEILWAAVLNNQLDIASMLIKAGADVNVLNPYNNSGSSLLYELLKENRETRNHKLAVLVMEHGADVNYPSCDGMTPLEYVILKKCTTDIVRELLKRGVCVNNHHIGGAADHPNAAEIVGLLVGGFVDDDTRIERIDHALSYCIIAVSDETRSLSIIKLLLGLNLSVVELKMFRCNLLRAVYRRRYDTVKFLVQRGFDINGSPEDPIKPIYAAASLQQSSITELLLEAGAEVNAVSVMPILGIQDYPIHAACRYRSLENIQVLLRNGADIQMTDSKGRTPFSLITYPEHFTAEHYVMIRYMAISVGKGKRINDLDKKIIENNSILNVYYSRCLKEIEKMKMIKIIFNVTFFSIFEKNVKELSYLSRNCRLLTNYDDLQKKDEFPIYEEEMDFIFSSAKKRKDVLSEKEKILCDSLENYLPYVPLEKIIYYMYMNELN